MSAAGAGWVACGVVALLAALPAVALLVPGGTAPVDPPAALHAAHGFPLGNVGKVRHGGWTATGVYLGKGWVLTAYHVPALAGGGGLLDFTVGGKAYAVAPGTGRRILNPAPLAQPPPPLDPGSPGLPVEGSGTDLYVFRIEPDGMTGWPALPRLRLAGTVFAEDPAPLVVLAGNGVGAGSQILTAPAGWNWGGGQAVRWGTNTVSSRWLLPDGGFGRAYGLGTVFDLGAGGEEAQAAVYDSGGPLFAKEAGAWVVAGILVSVSRYNAARDGDESYAQDLVPYRAGIAPYDAWAAAEGLPADLWEEAQDAGGRGVANGVAWVLGLDPASADAGDLPVAFLEEVGPEDRRLALDIVRDASAHAAGARIIAEASTDLVTWGSSPAEVEVVVDSPVQFRCRTVAPAGPGSPVYLRFRVEYPGL